jgi:hypothetical protein
MEYRVCSKCMTEKPMTLEFFGLQQKNQNRFLTECRDCKRNYHIQYRENKRLSQDPDRERMKQVYVYKEYTREEKKASLRQAYAHIYWEAFNKPITLNQLRKIIRLDE